MSITTKDLIDFQSGLLLDAQAELATKQTELRELEISDLFTEDQYIRALNSEEPNVYILGTFVGEAGTMLAENSPTTFRCLYNDWLDGQDIESHADYKEIAERIEELESDIDDIESEIDELEIELDESASS